MTALSDQHGSLYSSTTDTGDVDARLNGENHACLCNQLAARRNGRGLVNLKADTMPKAMAKVAAKAVSENVARNHDTAAKAMQGWLESESHKKTMEGNYTHTAISIKEDSQGNLYYTQLFYLQ